MKGKVRERVTGKKDINPDEFTKACQFIRPMLGHSPMFYGPRFYNCYVSTNPSTIHIVFKKPLPDEHYNYTLEVLRFDDHFIEEVNYGNYLVMSFKVPEIFEDDFYQFLDSKYSKMSDFYKEEILSLHISWRQVYRNLSDILYPQKKHREAIENRLDVTLEKDAEIFDRIEFSEELFDKRKFEDGEI